MKKIYSILLLSLIIPFYNYDGDDWHIMYEPTNIKSITEDSFNIYFLADNGIFSYDNLNEYFYYDIDLSHSLPKNKGVFQYIYYHPVIDYFFIITDSEVFYKSSVAFHWNKVNLSSLDIYSFSMINQIGFSDNFMIINANNNYMKINLYTMNVVDTDISDIISIDWISNNLDDIDLSQFYSLDNIIIGSNYITDSSKIDHIVTSYFYDKNEDLWVGMNTGAIYKINYFSYNIQRMNIGPRIDYISGLYNNGKNIWYFFDKYFRRTGNYFNNKPGYFLSIWNENNDSWIHIPKNADNLISNSNINDVLEIDNFVFLLTLDGFLIFDLKLERWYHSYSFLDNSDRSLWVAKNNDDKLYIGTVAGVVIADFKVINGKPSIYHRKTILNDSEIYDIEINNNEIYISSNNGLFCYDLSSDLLTLIDQRIYYNIELNGKDILASNKRLWKINHLGRELISSNVDLFKVADNDIICASNFNEIKIINLKTNDEWYMDLNYISNQVYSLDCDEEWLWFANSQGLLFFKWSNYE